MDENPNDKDTCHNFILSCMRTEYSVHSGENIDYQNLLQYITLYLSADELYRFAKYVEQEEGEHGNILEEW